MTSKQQKFREIQLILLERQGVVSDHFYLATSITYPNQNEAEDIYHLKQVHVL